MRPPPEGRTIRPALLRRRSLADYQLGVEENLARRNRRIADSFDEGERRSSSDFAAWLANSGERRGGERGEAHVIYTGDKDIAYPNLTAQIEAMRAFPQVFAFGKNIRYSVLENGWHDYPYMYRYLYHVLPEFFRPAP